MEIKKNFRRNECKAYAIDTLELSWFGQRDVDWNLKTYFHVHNFPLSC